MPEPKTVRVRIAVVVAVDGRWSAYGDSEYGDEDCATSAEVGFEGSQSTHFIEADVPIPQPQTIEGTVVQ